MTTTTAEIPDGERLARVETRVEGLELQVAQIRDDIREIRTEIRDLRSRMDRQFLWLLGIIITAWISLVALGVTGMITLSNRL